MTIAEGSPAAAAGPALALEARHVSRDFGAADDTVAALRDVNLSVESGEYLAITGPSGSGKSTLLHLLGGLDQPTSGEVVVNGEVTADLSRERLADLRNRHIGFVFQLFNLLPALTVEENVALPAMVARRRPAEYRARVSELLDLVGLSGRRRRLPGQLSGGEQQRVAIARALVMSPAVLLADEPTGNLDTATGAGVLELLRTCHGSGQTIVLVTHDVRVATQTDRVVFLRDGELVDDARLDSATERRRAVSHMIQVGEDDEA
jgi:putative ABC transport system ATP-binding protein